MKILIIGHARHGKDTIAEFIRDLFGLNFESSSVAASRIFLFDKLKELYGYQSFEECFIDRVNHRAEWYDLIVEYNKDDKARLAKEILKASQMYVGMRDHKEIQECKKQGIFNLILGVYNPRVELEPKSSFNIDIWKEADLVIPNAGTLKDLMFKVKKLEKIIR